MADQYDPNAVHNRGKQRINGSLTVTGAADFGAATINGKPVKTNEVFTDVIKITDTTPIEKIYDVSKYPLTYASIKVNEGTNCYVKPVLKQKNEDDLDYENMTDKFSSYYTDSTTSKLSVQNLFTKEKLKLAVTFEGDRTTRRNSPNFFSFASSFMTQLIGVFDAHNITLKCIKGGDNRTTTTNRYSSGITYQQQTETSYCGSVSLSGTVPTELKGIYRLYVNILRHNITSLTNEIYFNYFIMDEESDEIVVTSPENCFVDLKSSNPSFPLAADFYGLYINFFYDDELGALTGLEGNQNHFNTGDTLISSEIIGYPVFTCSVDDGDGEEVEVVGLGNIYPRGIFGNTYFYIKSPPENQSYFNKDELFTISIDECTVDAEITFKAY